MTKHYDVVVIGAGSMGLAAGYQLSRQGVRVLMMDAYDPPHRFGSHHGDTRIIRHAYGEGKKYVPFALRAQELWGELENESGRTLFAQTGILIAATPTSAFLNETIASAKEFQLPMERLSAEEIRQRWPGIIIPDHLIGCFEKRSGVLFSEECIRAYRELALANGAELLVNTVVETVEPAREGVVVKTKEARYQADKVIISAGPWGKKWLSQLGIDVSLQPHRLTVSWFEADESLFSSEKFPAFFIDLEEERYYGFPSFDGCGLKIGRYDQWDPIDPDALNREFGIYPSDEGDVRGFLQRYMPKAAGALKMGRVCMCTHTPDDHFIIDRHPEFAHVIITLGFSGHGFKFSSAVGEIASDLAQDREPMLDISPFSLKRFGPRTPETHFQAN